MQGEQRTCTGVICEAPVKAVHKAALAESTSKSRLGLSKREGLLIAFASPPPHYKPDIGDRLGHIHSDTHAHGSHVHEGRSGHDDERMQHIGDSTLGETVWNICNLVVGGGVLSMPFCCKLAGWTGGLSLIVGFAALFGFTAVLIGNVLRSLIDDLDVAETPKETRDFAMLARMAFGRRGAQFTALVLIAENWSAAVAYIIFVGQNLELVMGLRLASGVCGSGVLSLVMLYMPMRWLSYFGMMGMMFAGVATSTMAVQGIAEDSERLVTRYWLQTQGLGTAAGVVLFCFAGHACLPNVYWSMRHPKESYTGACVAAYIIVGSFYFVAAAVGYYYFGDELTASFTRALTSKSLQWLSVTSILVKIQMAVPPALAAPILCIEQMIGLHSWLAKSACRVVTIIFSILVALFWSNGLAELIALSGYMTTCYDSLIFPAAVALRLGSPSVFMRSILWCFVAFGVGVAGIGTWAALSGY